VTAVGGKAKPSGAEANFASAPPKRVVSPASLSYVSANVRVATANLNSYGPQPGNLSDASHVAQLNLRVVS
jgi:hypothetical protein